MTRNAEPPSLSRRERQIMDIVYRLGRATVNEVLAGLPDQPSYSSVRAQLRILEDKGHLKHEEDGLRYVYLPVVPLENASQSALRHVLNTFFNGSLEQAVSTLLGPQGSTVSGEELDRLAKLIAKARKGEKP